MAAMETVALSSLTVNSPSSYKLFSFSKPSSTIKLNYSISYSTPSITLNFPLSSLPLRTPTRNLCSQLYSAAQEVSVEKEEDEATPDEEEADDTNPKRKLFVYNLPFPDSSEDVKNLFAECGNVEDVEVVKPRFGKRKGYAFVTMASEEEAQSVIDRFDSQEVSGKIMKVDFAKSFKKPDWPPPPPRSLESRVHVANVDFKVRAAHLREFCASFNPISARVVFHKNRKTGYGFVGFATKEEAEAVIAVLDRKELMGRQLRLALSDKNIGESASKNEGQDLSEDQLNES